MKGKRLRWKCVAAVLLSVALSACEEAILHDLAELQANQAKVVLSKVGIESTKSREGSTWSVSVPHGLATQALSALEESRVLKRDLRQAHKRSKNLIQSKEERRHFLERELAWGLEQTLERFSSVLEARVHLNLDQEDTLELVERKSKQSASVLLIVSSDSELKRSEIQKLVSGASGVAVENISIVISLGSEPKPTTTIAPVSKKTEQSPPFLTSLLGAGLALGLLGAIALSMSFRKRSSQKLHPASSEDDSLYPTGQAVMEREVF